MTGVSYPAGTQRKILLHSLQQSFAYLKTVLPSSLHFLFPRLNKCSSFDHSSLGHIFQTSRSFLLSSCRPYWDVSELKPFAPNWSQCCIFPLDVLTAVYCMYPMQNTEQFYSCIRTVLPPSQTEQCWFRYSSLVKPTPNCFLLLAKLLPYPVCPQPVTALGYSWRSMGTCTCCTLLSFLHARIPDHLLTLLSSLWTPPQAIQCFAASFVRILCTSTTLPSWSIPNCISPRTDFRGIPNLPTFCGWWQRIDNYLSQDI